MIIQRLVVGGFGPLPPGLALEPGPGLNLVSAPNESGKSSLCSFITAMFYGLGRRVRGVHPFTPWEGGETGGELAYRLDGGQVYLLSRHLLKAREKLFLRDEAGLEVAIEGASPGEQHLGQPRGVFLTVSSIGLDDLNRAFSGNPGGEMKQTQEELLGYFFMEAATRGLVANPVGVQESWQREATTLFSSDKRSGKVDRNLAAAIAEAQDQVSQAREVQDQARQVAGELEALAAEAEALEEKRHAARDRVQEAQAGLERAQQAQRREGLDRQIQQLSALGLASDEVVQKARELERKASREKKAAQEARALEAQARREAAWTVPGVDPAGMGEELEQMYIRFAGIAARSDELQALLERAHRRRAGIEDTWGLGLEALADLDAGLGPAWDLARRKLGEKLKLAQEARAACEALGPRPVMPWWLLPLAPLAALLGLSLFDWGLVGGQSRAVVWGAALCLAWLPPLFWGLGRLRKIGIWQRVASARQNAADQMRAAEEELGRLLPPLALDPELLNSSTLAAVRSEARGLREELERLQEARAEEEEARKALAARLEEVGFSPSPGISGGIKAARRACSQAAAAQTEASRQEAEAQAREKSAAAVVTELAALLAKTKTPDMHALLRARERAQRVEALAVRLDELTQRMGNPGGEPVPDPGDPAQALDQARRALAEIEARTDEAGRALGGLREKLKHLESAPGVASRLSELARLEEERAALARRHGVLILGSEILTRVMERFRVDAQPRLLRAGGRYLAQATAGAYGGMLSEIFAPRKSGEPLLTVHPGGGAAERSSGVLSRGARDQLYLSLRLALGDEITGSGETLPLILDDPLVNFDQDRFRSASRMLAKVAERRQVILLTCHPHQAGIVSALPGCKKLALP